MHVHALSLKFNSSNLGFEHFCMACSLLYIEQTWSAWSPWSKCSVSCGGEGVRVRERHCQNGDEGIGTSEVEEVCEMEACSGNY